MKKSAILMICVLAAAGLGWQHRRALFWYYWSLHNRPPAPRLSVYREGRLELRYVEGPSLSKRAPEIARSVMQNLAAAEKQTGCALDHLEVRLYNNYEEKGADVRDIQAASADPDRNAVYCIVNDTIDGTRERLEFLLLLHKCSGAPAVEGRDRIAAAALAGVWNQKPLEEWRRFLLDRGLQPASGSDASASEFIRIPWNALYMSAILKEQGWNAFVDFYRGRSEPGAEDPRWKALLQPAGAAIQPSVFRPEFQKGISYAYENGYSSGYATGGSDRSLDELRKTGATWIAAIPYGFMPQTDATEIRYAGHTIFTENDESLFALADAAKKRGLRVMLKPQIWSHGGWTGMVDFRDDPSARRWFAAYRNWIVHYAVIAELTHADVFCVGTELVKTTLKWPDLWRSIIADVRRVYHGPLVYAANYGEEFEKLNFWDALDYMGLDNYYPVRSSKRDGIPEMKLAFAAQKQKIRALVERWNKPLLFTEIGYHANASAGMGSAEDDSGSYDESMQAACYRLAFETYWKEPWFYGMYWWKWMSAPSDTGPDADEHSPNGRLAGKVLAEWYLRRDRP